MTADRSRSTLCLALVALVCALAISLRPQPAHAAGCANEAIRAEQGAAAVALPECRAYELVSPGGAPLVESAGSPGLPASPRFGAKAADDGEAMAYYSYYPFQGSPTSGRFVRARRGASGWSLEAMSPQAGPRGSSCHLL